MSIILAFLAVGFSGDEQSAPDLEAPAAIRMIDVNGDGLLDRLRLGADGSLGVSLNRRRRQFEVIVQELPSLPVADVLVGDLNGDGNEDLYLVSPAGNVALLGDRTGRFVDATDELGLTDADAGRSAELIDVDADGVDDVLLHNRGGDVVFWAESGGSFARVQATGSAGGREESGGGGPSIGDVTQIALPTSCATTLRDASSGMCLLADSTPTLGRLYPLGPEFSVSPGGDVDIGDDVLVGHDGSGSVFLENMNNAVHRGKVAKYGQAATPNVTKQFNLMPGGAVITVSHLGTGQFTVDFGVDVRDRFFVGTSGLAEFSHSVGAAMVDVTPWGDSNPTAVRVEIRSSIGSVNQSFQLVVY